MSIPAPIVLGHYSSLPMEDERTIGFTQKSNEHNNAEKSHIRNY
jgi:hypothetical protein